MYVQVESVHVCMQGQDLRCRFEIEHYLSSPGQQRPTTMHDALTYDESWWFYLPVLKSNIRIEQPKRLLLYKAERVDRPFFVFAWPV